MNKISKGIKGLGFMMGGLFSSILGIFGSLGLCFCSFPFFASFLALLGISSFVLTKYNGLFLFVGIIFILISIYYFIKFLKK